MFGHKGCFISFLLQNLCVFRNVHNILNWPNLQYQSRAQSVSSCVGIFHENVKSFSPWTRVGVSLSSSPTVGLTLIWAGVFQIGYHLYHKN